LTQTFNFFRTSPHASGASRSNLLHQSNDRLAVWIKCRSRYIYHTRVQVELF
jgi:hypothetical protein